MSSFRGKYASEAVTERSAGVDVCAQARTQTQVAVSEHLRDQNDEEDAEERIARAPVHMR